MRTSIASGSRASMMVITVKSEKIIPASAGADALHIRTYDDKDNIRITEDRRVLWWDGSTWREVLRWDVNSVYLARSRIFVSNYWTEVNLLTGNIGWLAGTWNLWRCESVGTTSPGSPGLVFMTKDSRGNYQERFTLTQYEDIPRLYLKSKPASSSQTLVDSLILTLTARYWDPVAGASKDRDAAIFHRMLSTTPTSEIVLQIAGIDYMRVGDRGVKIDKVVFDAGSSISINAKATYTLPAGTYYVNLGPNTIAEVYDDVAGTWITLISAGGNGIVISDGSNARLRNTGTVAESSNVRRVL
jgi:hypothetical protein